MAKKKLIIAASAALVILGLGAGGAVFMLNGKSAVAKPVEPVVEAPKFPIFVQMEPLNVPVIRSDNKRYIYAIGMALQVQDEKTKGLVTAQMPRLRDAFLRQVNGQPLEGGQGNDAVNLELLKRRLNGQADKILGTGVVEDVLFHRVIRLQG